MNFLQRKIILILIALISIVLLITTLFDVFNEGYAFLIVITIYGILIIFDIILLFFYPTKKILK